MMAGVLGDIFFGWSESLSYGERPSKVNPFLPFALETCVSDVVAEDMGQNGMRMFGTHFSGLFFFSPILF